MKVYYRYQVWLKSNHPFLNYGGTNKQRQTYTKAKTTRIVIIRSLPLFLTSPLIDAFTWLTPPGPYRATTCWERELTLDHIILFWPHKDMEGFPGWGISLILEPHEQERRHTPFTHPCVLIRRIWKDDCEGQTIFGYLVGLKLPDISLTGEEKPRKNLTQETCPDRGSNPGPLRDKRACYHLLHSGGPCW